MERRNWENEIKKLINLFNSKEKGEIISYDEIEATINIFQYEQEFIYIVSKARAELIKNSIITKAIMFKGIKILKNNEIAEYIYEKYVVSSLRKQETALEILKYVDVSNFSDEEILELKKLSQLINKINRSSIDEIMSSQLALNKSKQLFIDESKKV